MTLHYEDVETWAQADAYITERDRALELPADALAALLADALRARNAITPRDYTAIHGNPDYATDPSLLEDLPLSDAEREAITAADPGSRACKWCGHDHGDGYAVCPRAEAERTHADALLELAAGLELPANWGTHDQRTGEPYDCQRDDAGEEDPGADTSYPSPDDVPPAVASAARRKRAVDLLNELAALEQDPGSRGYTLGMRDRMLGGEDPGEGYLEQLEQALTAAREKRADQQDRDDKRWDDARAAAQDDPRGEHDR